MIDIAKIGIEISMIGNAGQFLSTMMRSLTGINVATKELNQHMASLGKAVISVGVAFAGWKLADGLIDSIKKAEELSHELSKLQIGAGLSDDQTAKYGRNAFDITRQVPGSDVSHVIKQRRELFGVFGNMGEVDQALKLVAQGSVAAGRFSDKDTDLAQIAIKALEIRGRIGKDGKVDPKAFSEEFNNMVRAIVASEGLIDPRALLQFIQQAGPAAHDLSSSTMWGQMPAIMNAMGSSKAGTAMMSLYQQMVGHVVAGKRIAEAMERSGWLKQGSWKVERGGHVVMAQDAVVGQDEFQKSPIEWLHKHLGEMQQRLGKDNTEKLVQEIFQLSSRATSARLISDVANNYQIIQNEQARFNRMPDVDTIAKDQNANDLKANLDNLSKAWENFEAAFGLNGTKTLIAILQDLTNAINYFQGIVVAHPTVAGDLIKLGLGLSSLMIVGGSISAFTFAIGPFTAGLRALTGALSPATTAASALSTSASGLATAAKGGATATAALSTSAAGAVSTFGALGTTVLSILAPLGVLIGLLAAIAKYGKTGADDPQGFRYGRESKKPDGSPIVKPGDRPRWNLYGPDGIIPPSGGAAVVPPQGHDKAWFMAHPPHKDQQTIINLQNTTNVQIDGKTVQRSVTNKQIDAATLPPAGPTGPDTSVTPTHPSQTGAWNQ